MCAKMVKRTKDADVTPHLDGVLQRWGNIRTNARKFVRGNGTHQAAATQALNASKAVKAGDLGEMGVEPGDSVSATRVKDSLAQPGLPLPASCCAPFFALIKHTLTPPKGSDWQR